MTAKDIIGREGEEAAVQFLRSLGYVICGRNVRVGKDEVDILAHDPVDNALVFAEVKARSRSSQDFTPGINVHWFKKQRLMRAARAWVNWHRYDRGYRMDLISVVDGHVIEHLKELEWEGR